MYGQCWVYTLVVYMGRIYKTNILKFSLLYISWHILGEFIHWKIFYDRNLLQLFYSRIHWIILYKCIETYFTIEIHHDNFIIEMHYNYFIIEIDRKSLYCDMLCYQEREGEVNFPTFLCLNQQALRLTIKMIWMQVSYPHSITCSLLNKERNPGHSGIVTGWNSKRRKKSNDWPIDP